MLEQGTVGLLERARVADRRHREGLPHGGFALALDGDPFRINLHSLTWGRGVTVYGQTEVTKDLIEALMAHDDPDEGSGLVFEAEDLVLHDVVGAAPWITGTHAGAARRVCCDFIAGCDGDHGVSRAAILAAVRTDDERVYLLGWLGILADVRSRGDPLTVRERRPVASIPMHIWQFRSAPP